MNSIQSLTHPIPIAMWDFSWLERRWPGAGYEDWDQSLDELMERGYGALRIDPFPHFCATDPAREWELIPCWTQNDWGSPALNRVRIQPALTRFLEKCSSRHIKVALSSWWRKDRDDVRMRIQGPADHAAVWIRTLDQIAAAGLIETILYVDFCNEWPLNVWAPFFRNPSPHKDLDWDSAASLGWMSQVIAACRERYPGLAYTFSTTTKPETYLTVEKLPFDLLELHLWMTGGSDFYQRMGYQSDGFAAEGYETLATQAADLYRRETARWHEALRKVVREGADASLATGLPLVTTECWALIDYKDGPLLEWDWVKELCEIGVEEALRTERWAAIATSNFCGPQFTGMWRDVEWHRRLTRKIRDGKLPRDRSFRI